MCGARHLSNAGAWALGGGQFINIGQHERGSPAGWKVVQPLCHPCNIIYRAVHAGGKGRKTGVLTSPGVQQRAKGTAIGIASVLTSRSMLWLVVVPRVMSRIVEIRPQEKYRSLNTRAPSSRCSHNAVTADWRLEARGLSVTITAGRWCENSEETEKSVVCVMVLHYVKRLSTLKWLVCPALTPECFSGI